MPFDKAGIVGVGTIGRGWALLYAKAGYRVSLYDPAPSATSTALSAIQTSLQDMARLGLINNPAEIFDRVTIASTLEEAVGDAAVVHESVPEKLDAKRQALAQIDAEAPRGTIIASSCSSMLPASIFSEVTLPERCIVAHPFNPPHLVPLVELLPGPLTSEETLNRTREIMIHLDQVPVVLHKSVPGYVANRLQAAVINESMHLVASGVISPDDLDLCMTQSLGRRLSFLGPFATMDLNADNGVAGYIERFRDSYQELGRDLGVAEAWDDGAIKAVIDACRAQTPLEELRERREWRDRRLMQLLARGDDTNPTSGDTVEEQR